MCKWCYRVKKKKVVLQRSTTSESYNLSALSSEKFPESQRRGNIDIEASFRAEGSMVLVFVF